MTDSQRLDAMEHKLDEVLEEVRAMRMEVAETREIVAAWKSVKLWAQFIKWAAGIITAAVAIYAAWRGIPHK